MWLTEENKKIIDNKTYKELLSFYKLAETGNKWFKGETGKYWINRMASIEPLPEEKAKISKEIGI